MRLKTSLIGTVIRICLTALLHLRFGGRLKPKSICQVFEVFEVLNFILHRKIAKRKLFMFMGFMGFHQPLFLTKDIDHKVIRII